MRMLPGKFTCIVYSNEKDLRLYLAFPVITREANPPSRSRSSVIFLCHLPCPFLFATPFPISNPSKVDCSLKALNDNLLSCGIALSALVSVSLEVRPSEFRCFPDFGSQVPAWGLGHCVCSVGFVESNAPSCNWTHSQSCLFLFLSFSRLRILHLFFTL